MLLLRMGEPGTTWYFRICEEEEWEGGEASRDLGGKEGWMVRVGAARCGRCNRVI